MKTNMKLLMIFCLTFFSFSIYANNNEIGVCLNAYQDQNANTPRYFDLTVNGQFISETASNVELQTSTAWMSHSFKIASPIQISVTNGSMSCAADIPPGTHWINVTVGGKNGCEFSMEKSIPEPSCFPGPAAI